MTLGWQHNNKINFDDDRNRIKPKNNNKKCKKMMKSKKIISLKDDDSEIKVS